MLENHGTSKLLTLFQHGRVARLGRGFAKLLEGGLAVVKRRDRFFWRKSGGDFLHPWHFCSAFLTVMGQAEHVMPGTLKVTVLLVAKAGLATPMTLTMTLKTPVCQYCNIDTLLGVCPIIVRRPFERPEQPRPFIIAHGRSGYACGCGQLADGVRAVHDGRWPHRVLWYPSVSNDTSRNTCGDPSIGRIALRPLAAPAA